MGKNRGGKIALNTKKVLILSIALSLLIIVGYYVWKLNSYFSILDERPPYECAQHQDDTLRLSMIGDSWTFLHKPHDNYMANLISNATGKPAKVISCGISRLSSKEVYRCIYDNDEMEQVLRDGADFCFISVGINDSNRKMGARYYAHHTLYIIRFLLQNQVTPILLELPDYDVAYTFPNQEMRKVIAGRLSMFFNHSSMDCLEEYRQLLAKELEREGISQQVLVVPRTIFRENHFTPDRMHLNGQGYLTLDSCIANEILTSHSLPLTPHR